MPRYRATVFETKTIEHQFVVDIEGDEETARDELYAYVRRGQNSLAGIQNVARTGIPFTISSEWEVDEMEGLSDA